MASIKEVALFHFFHPAWLKKGNKKNRNYRLIRISKLTNLNFVSLIKISILSGKVLLKCQSSYKFGQNVTYGINITAFICSYALFLYFDDSDSNSH